jgi:hypothetical protein
MVLMTCSRRLVQKQPSLSNHKNGDTAAVSGGLAHHAMRARIASFDSFDLL